MIGHPTVSARIRRRELDGRPRRSGVPTLVLALALAVAGVLVACQPATEPRPLGPADGHDLPPTEIERVQVGDPAPDFTLLTLQGDTVTLSNFRGRRDVILVFYRGHW
jgi:hypothetical protein